MVATLVKRKSSLAAYSELKRRVHEVLLLGQQEIENLKVRTYHETGALIHEHLNHQDRAAHGKQILLKLSEDLDIDESVLHRCLRFYRAFPILARGPKLALSWSHYRVLITIPDEKERYSYLERAVEKQWSAEDLRLRVQKTLFLQAGKAEGRKTPAPLIPKRGKPGIYQIVELAGGLQWDLGFASYRELGSVEARRLKTGDIVRITEQGKLEKISGGAASDLYTYSAELFKLIDGDSVPRKTAQEMRVGPSGPACVSRFQSALSGVG